MLNPPVAVKRTESSEICDTLQEPFLAQAISWQPPVIHVWVQSRASLSGIRGGKVTL